MKEANIRESVQQALNGPQQKAPFFQPIVQPKLTVNEPGDVYEREADAVADRVMRMTDADSVPASFFSPASVPVQRKCAHCEEEEKQSVQRKEANSEAKADSESLTTYVSNLSGKGQPLSTETKAFFAQRMGHDFSDVRVHTNNEASASAKAINAVAYTTGNNIVFNQGQYAPQTQSGKHLLAHELTHVVQQNGNVGLKQIQRQSSAPAVVWGFEVWQNMCGCQSGINSRITDANDFRATYAACDTPANTSPAAVEACFDAAQPDTTVEASTAPGGAVTGPAPAANPCERIANHATMVHEHFHTRQADSYARIVGGSFFADWQALASTPSTRLATLRLRYPADHARFMALWNNGHEWAAGEVESYLWERRFLVDVRDVLNGFCSSP